MNPAEITGLVLAGGRGRRMGGVDKGLVAFRGRPLVEHALERLQPQVGELLISANQNRDAYARYGHPVLGDALPGHLGPLAGLHAGLMRAATPLLVAVPCDSPHFPLDLVARLAAAMEQADAPLAVARTGGRDQPVFMLCRRGLLAGLAAFLEAGGRKIDAWYAALAPARVDFDDVPDAFANANTLDELRALGGDGPTP